MSKTLPQPRVGDRRWFVTWTTDVPLLDPEDPSIGHDYDRAKEHEAEFATKEEADAHAREVYPLDWFGAVKVYEAEFTAYDEDDAVRYPHAGYWEQTGDGEHYEGE